MSPGAGPVAAAPGPWGSAARAGLRVGIVVAVVWAVPGFQTTMAWAQCAPEKPPLLNFTGAGRVTCPCFVAGEQAGAVFQAPAADYPLEVLRVGIGWGSQFGGTPQSLEEAIHVYGAGLPNPGTPVFSLEGPVLNDGAINQFNLEPAPGTISIASGPFSVTLEFLNENAGNFFAPSVVTDGAGCHPGRNLIYAIPGGWMDGCSAGLSGDWVFFVVYRPCNLAGVDETRVLSTAAVFLAAPRPNPAHGRVELEYVLAEGGEVSLAIHDVSGRRIAYVTRGAFAAGAHRAIWDGRTSAGEVAAPGTYFVSLDTAMGRARRTLSITR